MTKLDSKAFLALSPEEQATEMAKRVPAFAVMPKAQQQALLADLRRSLVPARTPVGKPTMSGYVAEGARRRAGDIAAGVATLPFGGPGVLPFAGRLLASEGAKDVVDWAAGERVTPGVGAISQLVGEGIGTALRPILSPVTYKAYARRTARALSDWLKDAVPAWKSYESSAKGLWDMAHGTGQRLLSKTFETAMRGIKGSIPETLIVHVPEIVEVAGQMERTEAPRNARALVDDLPNLRKAGGPSYRAALTALADQLPDGLAPELDTARREYRFGAGWIDFAEKGKFLHHERYAPETAQEALDRFGKRLLARGMDEVSQIIRGPAAKTITRGDLSRVGTATGMVGGGLGLGLGLPYWAHAGGAIGGGYLGHMVGRQIPAYSNIPITAAQRFAGRLGTAGTAEIGRETLRELGITEKLPGVGGP